MDIIQSFLTENPCYQSGKEISVKGLMLHSVGCPQPNAKVFLKNWNRKNIKVCVHAFVDGNTGAVYQTLPWNRRAWHCGGSANGSHIGVEMCEPDCIKYTSGSSFTCSDIGKARESVKLTYESAVELFATLCKKLDLNPVKPGVIVSHNEGYDLGIASNHGDPEHLWKRLGMGYTMDRFRKDVQKAMIDLTTDALRPGDTGEDVRKVQFVLNLANYYHGTIDGSYGAETTQAVKEFQSANGLDPDGKCGPKTQAVLWGFNFVVNQSVDKPDVKYTDVPDDIWYAKEIAKATELGIVKGVGNGEFDPERPVTRAECAAIAARAVEVAVKLAIEEMKKG